MSVSILKAPNADFDGDQLNLTLLPDEWLAEMMSPIAPHNWAISVNTPHALSGDLEMQGPIVETLVNWVHADYLPPRPEWKVA